MKRRAISSILGDFSENLENTLKFLQSFDIIRWNKEKKRKTMITSKDIIKAHKVLKGVVVETPLDYDHYLSEKYGAKIYLKK